MSVVTPLPLPKTPRDSWTDDRAVYDLTAKEVTGGVARLTTKDAWPWRAMAGLLAFFTAWRMPPKRFLEDFATTVGPVQGYPGRLARLNLATIVHEGRHTLQCVFCGWFVPVLGWVHRGLRAWVGLPLMFIAYILLPFPVGLSWGRYRLELDADVREWRWALRTATWLPARVLVHARRRAALLSSAAYGWAWPEKWATWGYLRKARRVIAEFEG